MKIGLGVDTGGTYTDAVLYEFEEKKILFKAKALTTKQDLSIGICNALDAFPKEWLEKTEVVSLSTTLATNACVENKGCRAKLIYLGLDSDVVEKYGAPYGLPSKDEIYFLNGGVDTKGQAIEEPDWDAFYEDIPHFLSNAEATAIVEVFGGYNPKSEIKAKEYITNQYDIPVFCGHELFQDLNCLKRGASTLLNGRLIPIIKDFLCAMKKSLDARNVKAPIVVVRSDCTLMTDSYMVERPVSTLLCGPAASATGGKELAGEDNSMIVDMGGTTTDLAIIKNGVPVKADDGVNIGKWQTFVKAIQVETIGLGGDSHIKFDNFGKLVLGPERVVPLCVTAAHSPNTVTSLKNLVKKKTSSLPLHEFICLNRDISENQQYTDRERALCKALQNGPLILEDAAKAAGMDIYNFNIKRLERESIVIRSALTPTDLMHINGDFTLFNKEAALLGAQYLAKQNSITIESLIEAVYERIKQTIYTGIVQMLLRRENKEYKKKEYDNVLRKLIEDSWNKSKVHSTSEYIAHGFTTDLTLVGLGAPIHIFLEDVAKALGTKHVIPEHANVANALGAIVGNVSAVSEKLIKPDYNNANIDGFMVMGVDKSYHETLEDAIKAAEILAYKDAEVEARRRGAIGELNFEKKVMENIAEEVMFDIKVVVTAQGSIFDS